MAWKRWSAWRTREKVGLVLAAVCVAALAVDRWVVRTIVRQMHELEAEILTERVRLAEHLRVLQEEGAVRATFESVRGVLPNAAAEPSVDIDAMKGELAELAQRTGLRLISLAHQEPRRFLSHMEYRIEIGGFEGSQTSLLQFLDGLRALPGLVRVIRLSAAPTRESGSVKGSLIVSRVLRVADA